MNRLTAFIFLLFLLLSSASHSQAGYLFVKKGIKKKRIYMEGSSISFKLIDGTYVKGIITLLRNDTIFLNGRPIHKTAVKEVLLKKRPKKPFPDTKTLLTIGAGAALTSAGLAISKQASTKDALIAGPVIGFAPLLLKHFGGRAIGAIPRKKFRIGKKFYLQILEFHIPKQTQRGF
jgi:hypothetical protein